MVVASRPLRAGSNQAPNGTIDTPVGPTTITAGGSVSFTGTGSDPDGDTSLSYAWNFGGGATNSTLEDPGSIMFNTAGTYTVSFTVTDSQGLPDSPPDTRVITVNPIPDSTAPTVSISAPTDGATVSASISVSATASDNVGVVGVQFKLDGANLGAEDTVSPYSITWDTTTATNGSHTLTAVARDAAGNNTTSAGVGGTVNNTAPSTLTFVAIEDTYIRSDSPGSTAGGTALELNLDAVPQKDVLLKFVVSDVGSQTITSAKLKLTESTNGGEGGTVFATTNAWSEPTTNWTNAPATTGSPLASIGTMAPGAVNSNIDVSSYITGDGTYSMRIVVTNAIDDSAYFLSRENTNSSVRPLLTLTLTPSGGGDTTAPIVSVDPIISPVSGSVTITATASDAESGIASIQFKLDGANLGSPGTASPYSIIWNTTGASEGNHAITAVATNGASPSLDTTSAEVGVTVSNADTTPPAISNPTPTEALPTETTQTSLGVWTDENATCKYSTVSDSNFSSSMTIFSATGARKIHSTTVSELSSGQTYTYYVKCQDSFENTSVDFPISFSVQPPATAPIPSTFRSTPSASDGGDNGLFEIGNALNIIPDSGGLCPTGMVWVPAPGAFCIDKYEASLVSNIPKAGGGTCPSACANPVAAVNPGINISSRDSAETYCSNVGKHLPTETEWMFAALGTPNPPPALCNVGPGGSVSNTGARSSCRSILGVYDMIGNVFEWTNNPTVSTVWGGSYLTDAVDARITYRITPTTPFTDVGFRCVVQ